MGLRSHLSQLGYTAVAGAALFVGQANAQNQPGQPGAAQAVQQNATVDLYMALMKRINHEDPVKRVDALRRLQDFYKKYEIAEESQKVKVEEIQERIRAELRAAELIKDLQGDDKEKREAAAKELGTELASHSNFHVRDLVHNALNEAYKDAPEKDPRRVHYDTSQFLRHLHDIGTVSSYDEWKGHDGYAMFKLQIEKEIQNLGSEEYKVRHHATLRLAKTLQELEKTINPIPQDVLDLFDPNQPHTLEIRARLKRIQKYTEYDPLYHDNKSRFPPVKSTADGVLGILIEYMKADIRVHDSVDGSLGDTEIETTQGTNDYVNMLTRVCQETNTYPVCNGSAHSITLFPQDKDNPREVRALDGAVAVIHHASKKDKGGTEVIELFSDPMVTFTQVERADITDSYAENVQIQAAPGCDKTKWTFVHSSGVQAHRQKDVKSDAKALAKDPDDTKLKTDFWVAIAPHEKTVDLSDESGSFDNGTYDFILNQKLDKEKGEKTIVVDVGVYDQKLDWSKTPHEADTETYAMGEATRIRLEDADGNEIPYEQSQWTINLRRMKCTLKIPVDKTPKTANIISYRGVQLIRYTMPLSGEKGKQKIVKPMFKIN